MSGSFGAQLKHKRIAAEMASVAMRFGVGQV